MDAELPRMRTSVVLSLLTLIALPAAAACGGGGTTGFTNDAGSTSIGSGSGGTSSGGGGGNGGSSGGVVVLGGGDGGGAPPASGDGGFVCAPNPANYDIPANGCDDDGDGTVDNAITCDTGSVPSGLSAAGTAADFAAAIGLCQQADATHWGVVGATYTNGHSQTSAGQVNFDQQHGVLTAFGSAVGPREGSAFGVLSSGSATTEDTDWMSDGQDAMGSFKGEKNGMQCATGGLGCLGSALGGAGNGGDVPTGFPKAASGCPGSTEVNDVIDVKLQIKVPANAKGIAFDFDFYSGEWPDFVCTTYNDSFIAYLQSAAFNGGSADNISFDSKGNPVSVNNGFFGICTPNTPTGCGGGGGKKGGGGTTGGTSVCSTGPAALAGTGFEDDGTFCTSPSTGGGATGWLTSQAPVKPGETISLEFIIWDTGDWNYDSSVLVDNLTWAPQEVPSTPVTTPSPPK